MPRIARRESPGVLFHVTSRFVDHRFEICEETRDAVLRDLNAAFTKSTDWRLLAYALMGSHWHVVCVAGKLRSTSWTRSLNTRIAQTIQHERAMRGVRALGAVFAGRPTFVRVPAEQLPRVIAYVHLNPVRASVAEGPTESDWTSHRVYVGAASGIAALQSLDGLSRCGYDASRAGRLRFHRFVCAQAGTTRDSLAWNADVARNVLRAARRELGVPAQIAGPELHGTGSAFEVGTRVLNVSPRPQVDPRVLVRAVAMTASISVADLVSHKRSAELTNCRRFAARTWVDSGGRVDEIAAVLGRTRSTIYHLLTERPDR